MPQTSGVHFSPGTQGAGKSGLSQKAVCPKRKRRVQKALAHLHRLEDAGKCTVFYGDESGFCLSPVVQYLWQPKGKTVGLPAKAHSRRLNVLGFL